mgnify:CR=1 FL=1
MTTVLPMVSPKDRADAASAAAALKAAIADPSTMGERSVAHLSLSRPRRGEWWTTWANLPGFLRAGRGTGTRYSHALLPGWEYTRREVLSEMIPDLEALAERGVRPTEATR